MAMTLNGIVSSEHHSNLFLIETETVTIERKTVTKKLIRQGEGQRERERERERQTERQRGKKRQRQIK
jgi:hypothetical protein